MDKALPSISIIIPTLNAAKALPDCLKSISHQDYPASKIKIIIADGGSTDNTISLVKKYHATIVSNPLKTAEAGKAIAIPQAKTELIALIDSDNILPSKNWLKQMVQPFVDPKIIGTEPYKFTYRPNSGIVERYSALIGANDPYAFVTGVYDRFSYINLQWTKSDIKFSEQKNYYLLELSLQQTIPTIGANGTIFRTDFIQQNFSGDYFFDIDIISSILNKTKKPLYFAKVKTGIIHTYCENSIKKFIRKQNRRVVDFYNFQSLRLYPWQSSSNNSQLKFILYTGLIIPSIFDSIRGFVHRPDIVWLLHPLFCQITLAVYLIAFVKHKLKISSTINRNQWQQ